jgi:Tol biopolymer transport system component
MVVDLASGADRELPLVEGYGPARWPRWAGRELILFGAHEADTEPGPSFGHLAAAAADGSWARVLDREHVSNALPAISPDWQTIAYDGGSTAWLYRWDGGPAKLDMTGHGVPETKGMRIGSPAWSPDGQRLAWVMGGNFDAGWRIGVAVLDLEGRTSKLLHLYEPLGSGGWPNAPVWSPGGQWLAYVVQPVADANLGGIWVLRADGLEERRLGPGQGPVWSPDGRWLVYSEPGGERGTTVWQVETDGWEATEMDLPDDALAVGWVGDGI